MYIGFDAQDARDRTTLTPVRLETVCYIEGLCVW